MAIKREIFGENQSGFKQAHHCMRAKHAYEEEQREKEKKARHGADIENSVFGDGMALKRMASLFC